MPRKPLGDHVLSGAERARRHRARRRASSVRSSTDDHNQGANGTLKASDEPHAPDLEAARLSEPDPPAERVDAERAAQVSRDQIAVLLGLPPRR